MSLRRPRRRKLKYQAFLSYSHKDEAIADWLHEELEAFRVPPSLVGRLAENGPIPRRLTPIFRDEHELAAADDLGDEIEAALASAQVLIVLCSPNAASSHWTNAEIETFKRSRPDGCILAAIASGEPFASEVAGREDEECFPPALRQKYDRRGRPTGKRAEPLAADLRDSGDGRRMGFLKLVAGMLGVGLDELVQRETTQRHRRLAWLAAASIAGMAVTSGLALTAIQARDSARDQRREAEGLVEFMVGDLKDKLEPIGKLDALDGVGARVLAYYSRQDTTELSDAGLLQRSRALSLTAQVANLRNDMDAAQKLYSQAMQGTAEAVRRDPDDPQRLFDHAQNIFALADLAMQRGELAAAESYFRDYKRLAAQMVALGPDNMKWRMEVQYADANLGVVLSRQRRYAEAATQFQKALQTIEALASADPGNRGYQQSSAEALAWLADAKQFQGRLNDAAATRERHIGLLNRLAAINQGDVGYRQRLIPAHRSLANIYARTGRTDEAIRHFEAAVRGGQQLLATEASNSKWLNFTATAQLNFAELLLELGRRDEARLQADAGCATFRRLLAAESAAPAWREGVRICLVDQALLALASGANDQALGYARQAVAIARKVHTPDAPSDAFGLARALRVEGDVHRARGDAAAARSSWSAAAAAVPKTAEKPEESAEKARIMARLGRTAEANALRMQLARMGYRTTT